MACSRHDIREICVENFIPKSKSEDTIFGEPWLEMRIILKEILKK
jgi:hypothetical protein